MAKDINTCHLANHEKQLINKELWVDLLRATGLSERGMWKWCDEFERRSPEAHLDFLEALDISEEEILFTCSASRRD